MIRIAPLATLALAALLLHPADAGAGLIEEANRLQTTRAVAAQAQGRPAVTQLMLKPAVAIDDTVVRLSDLFDGIAPEADRVATYAPPPGTRYVLDAAWLAALSRTHGLDWRPGPAESQVVVTRSSQLIGEAEIVEALRKALADAGAPLEAELQFIGAAPRLALPGGGEAGLVVLDPRYDPRTGRFSALLEASAGSPHARRIEVAGRLFPTVVVPVPVRPVRPGEVITLADIDYVVVREDQVKRDTVLDPSVLIGKAAKRPLARGLEVARRDIVQPVLVSKNRMVTLKLATPALQLTALAKAMEDGTQGALVRVQNLQSGKVVVATVTGENEVTVDTRPPERIAARTDVTLPRSE